MNQSINNGFKNYLNMIYVQVFKCSSVLHYVNSNSHVNVSFRVRLKFNRNNSTNEIFIDYRRIGAPVRYCSVYCFSVCANMHKYTCDRNTFHIQ